MNHSIQSALVYDFSEQLTCFYQPFLYPRPHMDRWGESIAEEFLAEMALNLTWARLVA
jgi:hypothetical protein